MSCYAREVSPTHFAWCSVLQLLWLLVSLQSLYMRPLSIVVQCTRCTTKYVGMLHSLSMFAVTLAICPLVSNLQPLSQSLLQGICSVPCCHHVPERAVFLLLVWKLTASIIVQ